MMGPSLEAMKKKEKKDCKSLIGVLEAATQAWRKEPGSPSPREEGLQV